MYNRLKLKMNNLKKIKYTATHNICQKNQRVLVKIYFFILKYGYNKIKVSTGRKKFHKLSYSFPMHPFTTS